MHAALSSSGSYGNSCKNRIFVCLFLVSILVNVIFCCSFYFNFLREFPSGELLDHTTIQNFEHSAISRIRDGEDPLARKDIESLQKLVANLQDTVIKHGNELLSLKIETGNSAENAANQDSKEIGVQSELQPNSKLAIFYNIYLPPDVDENRRKNITDEIFTSQINLLGKSHAVQSEKNKTIKFFYNTIGYPLKDEFMEKTCAPFDNLQPVHIKHYEKGDEDLTLNAIREYCQQHPKNNVIYVHPKGSFHPREDQAEHRNEATTKAASQECTHHMNENKCSACGTRFWYQPLHFAGNMWRAQCSYVQDLKDPREIEALIRKSYDTAKAPPMSMTFRTQPEAPPWLGTERFSSEHWIATHPNFLPCGEENTPLHYGHMGGGREHFDGDTPVHIARRHREYFLLPGALWRYSSVYGDTTIPPDDSWVWHKFPDGMEYFEAVTSLGSLKGAVLQIANKTNPFFEPIP